MKWLLLFLLFSQVSYAGELQIHYINVGQGGSNLIIGPDGTSIVYDFGRKSGRSTIVPYLKGEGFNKTKPIDYSFLSHRDLDHYFGYKDLVESEIDIRIANYGPGGKKKDGKSLSKQWIIPAGKTSAGDIRDVPVGLTINLGEGAEARVVAANGKIFDGTQVSISDENDRSIALLIRFGKFQFLLDGDLGGGKESCSGRHTDQKNVQTPLAQALLEANLLSKKHGLDVMHVAHHGSESSTSSKYLSLMKPEIALISVGRPNKSYFHPREDVVDGVLLGRSNLECHSTTKVKHVYQTDLGSDGCLKDDIGKCTSKTGQAVGDIVITTDGKNNYQIESSGRLWNGRHFDLTGKIIQKTFTFDE